MNLTEADDLVYVVTGASSGIGNEIAKYYLSKGVTVVGLSRSETNIAIDNYHHYKCDISNHIQVKEFFGFFKKKFRKLDVLINNAGCLTSMNSLLLPATSAQEMINTNILGTFLMSRESAKIMAKEKNGRIINISSMAEILQPAGDSIYAATKSAMTTLSNTLAKEYSQFNVTCNTLAITFFPTKMSAKINEKAINKIIENLPIPRMAKFGDISNVIDFFIDGKSSYITSQFISLGGLHK